MLPRCSCVFMLSLVFGARAAQSAPPAAASKPAGAAPASAPSAKEAKPGPKYLALRYNEDYSYLDGPTGSYQKDLFDPVKNIHLGKDWRLRLGGEVRERMEVETNKAFGARNPTTDTFLLQRLIGHVDLKYRDTFRIFFEGIDNDVFNRDLAKSPGMENHADINQVFFDVKPFGDKTPLTFRAGRQELEYGSKRVLAISDWGNQMRRFDGFKLMYQTKNFDVDFFWTKPVIFQTRPFNTTLYPPIDEGLNRKPDHFREEDQFFGSYATYKGIKDHVVDFYVLGFTDNGRTANANGHIGDLTLYTVGGRFAGKSGNFDYDVEGNGQMGKWAHDDVKAWMAAADAGYTFKSVPTTPRLGVGLDYASGDDTPRDSTHETYNQLFPSAHTFLGYLDLFGRQNLLTPNLNLTLRPLKDVTARLAWFHYWLPSNLDSAYNKTGGSARRNVSGSSGNDVGNELDLTVQWQIDLHNALLVGASHFWPGNFINSSGLSRDADLVYVQWQFKF